MAKIELIGWIEEVRTSWLMRVAEPHSKQENGKWITVARTYRDVKPAFGSSLDFQSFSKGDRVKIAGIEKTEVREAEGVTHRNLVVRAELVERVEGATDGGKPADQEAAFEWPAVAPLGNEPF